MGLPMYALPVLLLAALPLCTVVCAHRKFGYFQQEKHQAKDFFNPHHWTFFVGPDPTSGNVNYLGRHHAEHLGLAYAQGNTFVMAVDSTNDVPAGGKRNSVRITSKKRYNGGLFVLDAAAMPTGCGMWPSFWTVGPNWPNNGEIDIVEGINNQPRNQMTLHSGTTDSCTIQTGNNQFTGSVLNSNCYSNATFDSGCTVMDASANSFGPGFNNVGGGVFAFWWDSSTGISMWHFTRSNIPEDIRERTFLTPLRWGKPAGFWSASSCNMAANFIDHSMIFDMTICGSWAEPAYSQSGCPGTCSEMVANASNFADAKWVINYLDVYQPVSSKHT